MFTRSTDLESWKSKLDLRGTVRCKIGTLPHPDSLIHADGPVIGQFRQSLPQPTRQIDRSNSTTVPSGMTRSVKTLSFALGWTNVTNQDQTSSGASLACS